MATNRFTLGACLLLAACSVGPNYQTPESTAPADWHTSSKITELGAPQLVQPVLGIMPAAWWHVFQDIQLDQLEDQLTDENLDVQTAIARLAQARAARGVAIADFYPQVNGTASFTREKPSDKGAFSLLSGSGTTNPNTANNNVQASNNTLPTPSKIPPFNIYQYGFDANWELDIWGGTARGIEEADALVDVVNENKNATLLSVQAELARDYLELRGTQAGEKVVKATIAATQTRRELAISTAKAGLSSEEDTTSLNAQLAQQTAQLPQLAQQKAALISQISLLLNKNPGVLNPQLTAAKPLPALPATVPVSIPSQLAANRPDIRAAAAQLHAATATIGVAEAAFYPQITFMGNGMIQALHSGDLAQWAARTWSFGPSISLPIFEGGRLTQTLELREAQQQEAAIAYRKTLLTAFHEVDNALTAILAEQQRVLQLTAAAQQQQLAMALATSRYQSGLTNFIEVLVAQQNLFATQQELVTSKTILATNLIQLYKALGGSGKPP